MVFSHRRPRGTVTGAGVLLGHVSAPFSTRLKLSADYLLQQDRIAMVDCPRFSPADAVREGEVHRGGGSSLSFRFAVMVILYTGFGSDFRRGYDDLLTGVSSM